MKARVEVAPQLLAADRTQISEIMTPGAVTVRADLGLEQLVSLFLEQDLSRAPVVDDTGQLIGIVSKTDLVVDQYVRGDTGVSQLGADRESQHVHELGGVVRDVMTPVAFTLPATTTLGDAARRMLADHVHAVPVTSGRGQVIGILSATDVMAWVAGVHLAQSQTASVR